MILSDALSSSHHHAEIGTFLVSCYQDPNVQAPLSSRHAWPTRSIYVSMSWGKQSAASCITHATKNMQPTPTAMAANYARMRLAIPSPDSDKTHFAQGLGATLALGKQTIPLS